MDKQLSKLKELLSDIMVSPDAMKMMIEVSGDHSKSPNLRHFDKAETDALTPEARGYLLELSRTGRIDQSQMEMIIQFSALTLSKPVTELMLHDLVDNLIFSFSDDSEFDGHTRSSDVIN